MVNEPIAFLTGRDKDERWDPSPLLIELKSGRTGIAKHALEQIKSKEYLVSPSIRILSRNDILVVGVNFADESLHIAARNGHEEVVGLLLKKGANINAINMHRKTPLHLAAQYGHKECSKTLIKYTVLLNYGATKPDYIVNNTELSEFWNDYKNQVEKMQGSMLGNSTISVHRFLRETNKNKLAGCLSNENTGIRKELEKAQYAKNFPTYASMIADQFNKGKKRECLLYKSNIVMEHCDLEKLPAEIRGKVANSLTNADLENLVKSAVNVPSKNLDNPNVEQQLDRKSKIKR